MTDVVPVRPSQESAQVAQPAPSELMEREY